MAVMRFANIYVVDIQFQQHGVGWCVSHGVSFIPVL
jgi:hypothetical protein